MLLSNKKSQAKPVLNYNEDCWVTYIDMLGISHYYKTLGPRAVLLTSCCNS